MRTHRQKWVALIPAVFSLVLLMTGASGRAFSAPVLKAPPLHVEGRHLKDPDGRVVVLRGVNHHGFLDVPDGAWDAPGEALYSGMGRWDPEVVQRTLDDYREYGFNVVRLHTVVDWWKTNPRTYRDPYRRVTYAKAYRGMVEDVVRWAGERGLYVIFDFFALRNVEGVQSGQESLPWPPWGRDPQVIEDRAAFARLWESVAKTLGRHPNALFELYNEPHGDAIAEEDWFRFVGEVLPAMRKHTRNPVIVQWDYMVWVNLDYPPPGHAASTLDWIARHPLDDPNVVYGTHLYRNSGGGGAGSVHRSRGGLVNLWERKNVEAALALAGFPEVLEKLNKPLLVTEIGAWRKGDEEDQAREIQWLKNTLSALNQRGVGYVGWAWQSDRQLGHGMLGENGPNPGGKALWESLSEESWVGSGQ